MDQHTCSDPDKHTIAGEGGIFQGTHDLRATLEVTRSSRWNIDRGAIHLRVSAGGPVNDDLFSQKKKIGLRKFECMMEKGTEGSRFAVITVSQLCDVEVTDQDSNALHGTTPPSTNARETTQSLPNRNVRLEVHDPNGEKAPLCSEAHQVITALVCHNTLHIPAQRGDVPSEKSGRASSIAVAEHETGPSWQHNRE